MRGVSEPVCLEVLIADDEALLRRLMTRVLEADGHRVQEATNGDEALAALDATPDGIDVVVLDLGMPPHGALETLERMLALRPHVGIVLTSGLPPDPSLDGFISEKRCVFLQKPFAPEALRRAVDHAKPRRVR
jgi:DNA-binding NtrC family response regulator